MKKRSKYYEGRSPELIKKALVSKIYYFNRFGEVKCIERADSINRNGVRYTEHYWFNKYYTYDFAWDKYGVDWFFNEEQCRKKAEQYLKMLGVSSIKFKHIYNYLFSEKYEWVYGKPDGYYISKGYGYEDGTIELGQVLQYEKDTGTFVIGFEYDDDFGGGYSTYELKMSRYGKDWAIYKKDLKKGKRK